jgi:hypothetical protein
MTLSQSILATLAYHDIFDYPLAEDEITRFLIEKNAAVQSIKKELPSLVTAKKIVESKGYHFLKKRSEIVVKRVKRTNESKKKLRRAKVYSTLLKTIPTIKMLAISGALAMENSDKGDDIDFVIATSNGTLWTTRFLANAIILPFKRDPSGKKVADKACLNLFLDESALKIKEQNLYTAHEICQMKLLWDRDNTYERFLKANSWTKKYLPNWSHVARGPSSRSLWRGRTSPKLSIFSLVEKPLKNFQLWYMRNKVTTEKIGDRQLFFHPKGTETKVLNDYEKKIKELIKQR